MDCLATAERYRECPTGSRSVSNSCRLRIAAILSICAFLAACSAGPTEPLAASSTETMLTGNDAAQDRTGELRFLIMPPEALMGGMAEARR